MNASAGRELNPWYQGCLVEHGHAEKHGWKNGGNADDVLVVITHDCDLQSGCGTEETVEILRARWQDTSSGEYTYGKNPRAIHLHNALESGKTLVVEQSGKLVVNKSSLLDQNPSEILSDGHRRQLAAWLASRYNRAPFPDSFNNRLKKARTIDGTRVHEKQAATLKRDRSLSKELIKAFESDGQSIEGIYISLGENSLVELDSDTEYSLSVVVVATSISESESDEAAQLELANKLTKRIRGVFDLAEWDTQTGVIDLVECLPATESDFSLYQYRRMLRWHLDWMSPEID